MTGPGTVQAIDRMTRYGAFRHVTPGRHTAADKLRHTVEADAAFLAEEMR